MATRSTNWQAYIGLDLTTLQTFRQNAITGLQNAMSMQSYGVNSRHVQRANITQLSEELAAINYAIARIQGTRVDRTLGAYRPINNQPNDGVSQ